MKFLHTADLHIGKRLSDISLLEDQAGVLDGIIAVAEAEQVDGILIAGDIYQQSTPTADAMGVFSAFLTKAAEKHIPVYAVSGNHDSDIRISYYGELVRLAGIHVTGPFTGMLQTIHLEDVYGPLDVHLLPFFRPQQVQRAFPEEKIKDYVSAVQAILAHSQVDETRRNVLIMHQLITGATLTGDEERSIGGVDDIPAGLFDAFDYVAMGHIHGAQRVGRDTMRYSGSPIKYSLSEAGHHKSVTIVTLGEKGSVDIRLVPTNPPRDVREVRGTLEEVMAMTWSQDLVRVTLTDEEVIPDARVRVGTVFPNMIRFAVDNTTTRQEYVINESDRVENASVEELFAGFFAAQHGGVAPSDSEMELLSSILRDLEA